MSIRNALRLLAILAAAIAVGTVVTLAGAMLGHEFLVLRYGEDGIAAVDDTPVMFAVVASAYGAGALAGLLTIALAWRQLRRRP